MSTTILSAVSYPGDRLVVTGTNPALIDTEGNLVKLVVTGWQSAQTNYYPPSSYDASGNLIAGSTPRPMTSAEQLAYQQGLIEAQLIAMKRVPQ